MKRIIVKEYKTEKGTTAYYFVDKTDETKAFDSKPEAIAQAKEQIALEGGGIVDFAQHRHGYQPKRTKGAPFMRGLEGMEIVASYNVKGNYLPDSSNFS